MENKNMPAYPVEMTVKDDLTLEGAQTGNGRGFAVGLSKREYFAGLAMQGMMSNEYRGTMEQFAKRAVQAADALLLELSKPQP